MSALQEFFAMGGYAFFVWTAYGLGAVVLIANAVWPLRRERQLLAEIAARSRRRARVRQ